VCAFITKQKLFIRPYLLYGHAYAIVLRPSKPPWLTQNIAQWRQDRTWLT